MSRIRLNFRYVSLLTLVSIGLITFTALPSGAQSSQQATAATPDQPSSDASIAAAAKQAKNSRTGHAKKVFTDEDMEATAGPLPRLRMDGPENGDEIVAAITKYKATHTPAETERAIHIWFDRYDEVLAAAIQENKDMQVLRNANSSNGYELCQESGDYEKCRNRQMAEMRGARNDAVQATKNNELEVRIQHAFMKVRNGLSMNNIRYDWFKVRTTNGIDSF